MKSNFLIFLFLVISLILLSHFSSNVLNIEELTRITFSPELSQQNLEKTLNLQKKWAWISYLIIPIFLFLKINLTAIIIFIGAYLFNKNIEIKRLYNVLIKAEFIFLLVPCFKVFWFLFFQNQYTLQDIQFFYPFSGLNLIGYESIDPWFIYPLQVLNLFEVAYWFILAYLLGKELNISMDKGFKIVASSYGPALAIWVVAVMFITLNYS